ncbi:UDP-forming cellulose synthase catalytic subunit [Melaminivora suipulveris]|uniref:Cellulose synthase catalytic subunit [UDP-forming] n=1 Tax=Melaminivora suipulveris TaxID=2109913 RepID=A0A2R3QEW3_9BURK|nr:UDP-forming cellulose synthase catalytic subunit [Melaminivora suipulveris]AVO50309.1 UDP-forming cellulose synthase catalytic subunit [Melaminivora suipulveris]
MSAHAILVWLARQLQVAEPRRLSSWLRSLVLKPPVRASARPAQPQDVPDPCAALARALGLPLLAADHRLWLQGLFVSPAPDLAFWPWLGRELAQIAAPLAHALRAALHWLSWPLRQLIAALETLAATLHERAAGPRLGQALDPLMASAPLRWLMALVTVAIGLVAMTTPLNWLGQVLFLASMWMLSMVLRRLPGRYPSLALAAIGLLAMGRYAWWRVTTTLEFDTLVEAVLGYGLLAAEAYTWLIVVLGFVQSAWPLKRHAATLPADPATWPTVDVLIPTYNEALSVVRPAVLAALALDWPADRLRVHLLDDGRREEFRAFAAEVGVHYLARTGNLHAKAGNLNHALGLTDGELVAIFDCDHIVTRSFLKATVGWFLRDPRCAMLQTPHHFFSPDPFERNLGTFRRVPNEGALFYGLVQDGNDFWNATFFCGSCAVIRRAPLMEVGGIATETVTEDAHTALKLHRRGYTTAYLNETLAAGLATESLSAHVGQRIRWARGMAQIFRTDNPLLGPGLTLWQRLCYSNAMLHFLFGLPRLVFLTAPMAYLFFHVYIIHAQAALLALYVLPYILQSSIANAHVQGRYRHTFWAEVYETVLAWYVALPTTLAMLNPKLGKFNVTAKGGLVERSYFDWTTSLPYVALVLLNLAALAAGVVRLVWWNTDETGTVLLNLIWTSYSLIMLGAAMGVALEARQVRSMHRVAARLPAALYLSDGRVLRAACGDYSMTGLGLEVDAQLTPAIGELVHVGLWWDERECAFPARVAMLKGQGALGVQFAALTPRQQVELVQCTFARPDSWTHWDNARDADRPLQGLREIIQLGLRGYRRLGTAIAHGLRQRVPEAGPPVPAKSLHAT